MACLVLSVSNKCIECASGDDDEEPKSPFLVLVERLRHHDAQLADGAFAAHATAHSNQTQAVHSNHTHAIAPFDAVGAAAVAGSDAGGYAAAAGAVVAASHSVVRAASPIGRRSNLPAGASTTDFDYATDAAALLPLLLPPAIRASYCGSGAPVVPAVVPGWGVDGEISGAEPEWCLGHPAAPRGPDQAPTFLAAHLCVRACESACAILLVCLLVAYWER